MSNDSAQISFKLFDVSYGDHKSQNANREWAVPQSVIDGIGKRASTSFLKKRSKKLLFSVADSPSAYALKKTKVFWVFFSKKTVLVFYLLLRVWAPGY